MGYIESGVTVWKEHCSTSDKLAGLNKLEGMYSESVSYIDSILHAERYYDKAETSTRYFTSATDGTGTGLVCQTLDGYTADQIIAAGTPSGCIAWWSGSEASIPAGWLLCDGANGTPNIRNRLVVGAGGSYAKGATGGAAVMSVASTVSIATHALTADEIPAHTHDYGDYWRSPAYSMNTLNSNAYQTASAHSRVTTAGTSTAHGHAGSTGDINIDVLPPYIALCAIMKS